MTYCHPHLVRAHFLLHDLLISFRRALLCDSVLWIRIVRVLLHLLYSQHLSTFLEGNGGKGHTGQTKQHKTKGQFRYSISIPLR